MKNHQLWAGLRWFRKISFCWIYWF